MKSDICTEIRKGRIKLKEFRSTKFQLKEIFLKEVCNRIKVS